MVGWLLSLKWPSTGGVIVCTAAMTGPISTYERGEYRWIPYLHYWDQWVLAWIWDVFAGFAAHNNVSQESEKLADARHLQNRGGRAGPAAGRYRRVGPVRPFGGGQASSRMVTGPSLTRSTCMCAPKIPVWTGTPSARSAST